MNFNEALQALLDGKFLVRAGWKAEDGYITKMPGMQFAWRILTVPTPNAGNYMWLLDDFLATDWKVYDGVYVDSVVV